MKAKNSVIILIMLLTFGVATRVVRAAEDAASKPAVEEVNAGNESDAIETAPVQETAVKPAEGNAVEAAKVEEVKPVESAAPVESAEAAKGEGEKKESLLEKYPPQVKLSQWGPEIRINVIPDSQMGAENVLAVQSVKLETEKGEYLGLKTFQPEEKTREAEFMINPEILKVDAVKITVSSKLDGQWTHSQVLKSEEGKGPEAGKPDAVPAAAPDKPKKKGWWG